MVTVDTLLDDILKREGGYNNIKEDQGGETKFGISKRSYPDVDIPNLTEGQARHIYKRDYFFGPGIDQLPSELQPLLFDYAINSGPAYAIEALQKTVGATVDGKLGPDTLSKVATSSLPLTEVVRKVAKHRIRTFARICQRNPSQLKFLVGWIDRGLEFL